MTSMNVAGSPSPVGSLLPNPNKPKNQPKTQYFRIFLIWTINLYCPPQETTQTHIWNLHVEYLGIYVFKIKLRNKRIKPLKRC